MKEKGLVSFKEKLWLSGTGALGVTLIALFFPLAKIGRFEFRLFDYFADNGTFMNGIRWFTGHGTSREAAVTYTYLLLLALLPVSLALLGVSLFFKERKRADLAVTAGLGLSAAVPALFIILLAVINGGEKTSSLTLFTFLALAVSVIPLLLLILFLHFTEKRFVRRLYREKTLWLISGIALAWVIIFAYVPMAGVITAFFNYKPGMSFADMEFVGLRYFKEFFLLPDFMKILRNTLVISGLGLSIGFVSPIIFALLLSELSSAKFRRGVQTVSYMPYFVSWVVVASIMTVILNSDGLLNEVLLKLKIIDTPVSYLNNRQLFWWVQLIANIWKNIGWGSIIYLAALSGVDQELIQAGAVDGLGRFGRVWHIKLPGIRPTIVLLFILGIGGIFNTGFEYQLLLGTPLTRDVHEVVDTYVYRYGIQQGRYSFATAVGLMKSVIGFTLVIVTNYISKKVSDISIL